MPADIPRRSSQSVSGGCRYGSGVDEKENAADLSIDGFAILVMFHLVTFYRFLAPGIRSSWIPPVPTTAGRQPSFEVRFADLVRPPTDATAGP